MGCSGSGKTTLARSLASVLRAPHVELDSIFHQPGWTPLGDEEFQARVADATKSVRWVVDGNYSAVQPIVWAKADTVVWFDLPFLTALGRTIRRTLRRMMTQEELWNGNREPLSNLWSLDPQRSIIMWTATQHGRYRRRYAAAARDAQWSAVRFVRLGSQAEADGFLAGVVAASPSGDGVTED